MKNKNSPVAMFLSPDVSFRPFDMEEITFDVFGLHCLDKAVSGVDFSTVVNV